MDQQTNQPQGQPVNANANPPAAQAQGGTAVAEAPASFDHPGFSLSEQQSLDLQRYRTDTIKPGFADNALSVLLVGRSGWTCHQVQQAFGIKASDAARACRAWTEGGLRGVMNTSEATYLYANR